MTLLLVFPFCLRQFCAAVTDITDFVPYSEVIWLMNLAIRKSKIERLYQVIHNITIHHMTRKWGSGERLIIQHEAFYKQH